MVSAANRQVLRWEPYVDPDGGDMEFRLTYAGPLLAHKDTRQWRERTIDIHNMRREFHKQLERLWQIHPVLLKSSDAYTGAQPGAEPVFNSEGFVFKPIVTESLGLICKLEILILKDATPGNVLFDIDNRLKTLFDALRMPIGPDELGAKTAQGIQRPGPGETPFYVLLQDDKLITHLAVTTDRLLEPVPNVPRDQAVRLVIDVTVRPYDVHMDNLAFT